ncbi:MAG: serine/threonine protein kinase [Deltaproteobacteria bacterium]|nr:serine/threonine protein kinase [Deltaproteobacteria bacterium]
MLRRQCPICGAEGSEPVCPVDGMATLLLGMRLADGRGVQRGTIVGGRYRVAQRVGQGAYGVVFAATHLSTGQEVAVKVLTGDGTADETALRRFFLEAKTTASLRHPNTVRVFDFGQDDAGHVFLAMELLRGKTLRAELADRRRGGAVFSEAEALEVGLSVARSLAEAHGHGLVHRDLKPDNIFLTALAGGECLVKVCDFGIAKTALVSMATDGPVGTPAYMSPEQADGHNQDGRSDLYALGAILFELVTGRPPFLADSPVQLLMMHVKEVPPRVEALAATSVSPDFASLVHQLLAKDPAARGFDAAALRDHLTTKLTAPTLRLVPAAAENVTTLAPQDLGPTVLLRSQRSGAPTLRAGGRAFMGLSGAALLGLTLWWAVRAEGPPAAVSPPTRQSVEALAPAPPPLTPPEVPSSAPPAPIPEITLDVDSVPAGAAVFLDGEELGKTPLELKVPAGAQGHLQLKKDGFLPWTQTIRLDVPLSLRAPLKALPPAEAPRPFRTTR